MSYLARVLLLSLLVVSLPHHAEAQESTDKVDLAIDAKESARLFDLAVDRWKGAFRPKRLRSQLRALAEGGSVTPELRQELYEARKSSAIIRSSFQLLDHHHYKPAALDRYVRAAGKLNDAINSGLPHEVPQLANKALQAMDVDAIRAEVKAFRPTSAGSFRGYLYTSMRFVDKQSQRKTLAAPAYHQLRKELTNLLVLLDPNSLSPANKQLHDRLHTLRLSMGDVHDALVESKMKGGNYKKSKVPLDKMTRREVRNVLRSLEVSRPGNPGKHYRRWSANIKPGRGASKARPVAARR